MDKKTFCSQVRRGLSSDRLTAYSERNDEELDTIARYLWNTALCQSLYPTLQCFEVLLRNAIHDSVKRRYGDGWLESQLHLRPSEARSVTSALNGLYRQGKANSSTRTAAGRIIAELSFGFWSALFVRHYDRIIAIPVMKSGLNGVPNNLRNRENLFSTFDRIRHLRNRVFHHEPVHHWSDLPIRHLEIVNYIGYMNPAHRKIVDMQDTF